MTTSKTDTSGTTNFVWDYENRLKQATKPNGTVVNFKYDALGRRSERNVNGTTWTKFTYDGQDVMLDQNSDGTTVRYLNGLGIDNKLRIQNGTAISYFLSDHLGSTTAQTDATGNITNTASYDGFGNSTNNLTTRYQFTGREFDADLGLQYSRARWYDAKLGRFISEDPIGFGGSDVNIYNYVGGNPQNFIDPLGLQGGPGSNFADWNDERIEYARDFWKRDPQDWIYNGTVDTGADIALGFSDMFRVGNGVAAATCDCDENAYGRAAFVAADVARASGLFSMMAGPFAGRGTVARNANEFPDNPNSLLPELPRDARGTIYTSDKVRIRPEKHPLKSGETFSPRHHGQHYHVEIRANTCKSWKNKGNTTKIKPPGYKPGDGTGFLPGEQFP